MDTKRIREIQVGEDIQGYYLLKEVHLKVANNQKKYIDLVLMDETGEVSAKLWEVEEPALLLFKEGKILKIMGKVTQWQTQKQVTVQKYRPLNESDSVKIEDFVPSAPIKMDVLYDFIRDKIGAMKDEPLKKLTKGLMDHYGEAFKVYPAAKSNHHAIRSGLMYHLYRMLEVAESLVRIYPHVNRDLLVAGVILHDICKIEEMKINELGLVSDYSKEGQMLGHIIIGIKRVDEMARRYQIPEETSLMVQHMILSHHYEPEFGSPKKPMFIEAELLHHIDMIDARVYDFEKVVGAIEAESFSEPVWTLDKRRIYKPKA